MPGDGFFCQIEDVPHPADTAAAVRSPVLRAQPPCPAAVPLQQRVPVKAGKELVLVALAENVLLFQAQYLGTAGVLYLVAEVRPLNPKVLHAVQIQIGPHPHDQIRHQQFRQPVLVR